MTITIIHGQNHKGSTYHVARMLADKVGGRLTRFFLPRILTATAGCTLCFARSEKLCPHRTALEPMTKAIDEADPHNPCESGICFPCHGLMKTLLDHYGYRWMIHRPYEGMFRSGRVYIDRSRWRDAKHLQRYGRQPVLLGRSSYTTTGFKCVCCKLGRRSGRYKIKDR